MYPRICKGYCDPSQAKAWAEALQDHPDRAFALYIQRGIANGFRIGFEAGAAPLRPRISSGELQMVSG